MTRHQTSKITLQEPVMRRAIHALNLPPGSMGLRRLNSRCSRLRGIHGSTPENHNPRGMKRLSTFTA